MVPELRTQEKVRVRRECPLQQRVLLDTHNEVSGYAGMNRSGTTGSALVFYQEDERLFFVKETSI